MAPEITFTPQDHEVMLAIINQMETVKIDRKQFALDLGLANVKTADARLTRFKAKLAKIKDAGGPVGAGTGGEAASTNTTKAKRATPAPGKKTNKRKLEKNDDEDEDGEDSGAVRKAKTGGRKAKVAKKDEGHKGSDEDAEEESGIEDGTGDEEAQGEADEIDEEEWEI